MNVVKDLQSLIQLMHSHNEVIIFPISGEGQQLLDFLRYADFLNRVCCIAATKVDGGVEQKFIHEVPVIPFENLVHFRETALLIVSAPEQLHANIDAELTRFGFKTFVFVRNDTHAQIINELQKMYSTGQIMMWYMRHFDEKITELEYRIDDQNKIGVVNTKAFAEYRNLFRNQEIVIVGTGPTLDYYEPLSKAIHIGLNYAWKRENISLDYLFTADYQINQPPDKIISQGFGEIKNRVFIGDLLNHASNSFCGFPENYSADINVSRFVLGPSSFRQPIYQDICHYTLADFWTIAFPAIHFALYTYPKKIYLVGCDTSTSMGKHFYDPENFKKPPVNYEVLVRMKVGYARMKMFAKHYYPDTEIISINPVGLRGLFKDVYTDEYKATLAENGSMTPSFSGGGYRIRDDPYSVFAKKFVA